MPSKPEVQRIKTAANEYAKSFLARKYHEEFRELYMAYLLNRGVTPHRSPRDPMVDEREILKQNQAKKGNTDEL